MKDLAQFINEALNEAISIPRKFNTSFTYDDLEFTDEETKFLKKYLKTNDVYQLPEFDENGNDIKQFSKMYNLLGRSKELEVFNFDSSTYTAYELPKGNVVVFVADPGYNGSCFYLSSNKINEAKAIPGIGRKSFDDIAMAIFDEGDNNGEDWSEQLEDNDVYDVLEYWAAFEDIAKKLRVDAGELRDWVMANEEALKEYLLNA